MKITVRTFFRSIVIRNKEVIPAKGPLLVLANHPSTFMDPIVIATILNREVYFLGKGQLFKSKLAKWLLPKFNIIPVYRKQDDPSQMSKNQETFEKCFQHLEKGGAILMFPEGISITERKLRPIKTGAARIVLGAEEKNNFQLGVHIVNIGLNYSDPHKFNRDLFINIHKPITVANYKAEYTTDTFKGAQSLTAEITKQLENLIIAIEDKQTDELVQNIETLYKSHLSEQRGITENQKDEQFIITKNIIATVNYFLIHDPKKVETLRNRINQYFKNLAQLSLQDFDIAPDTKSKSFITNALKALLIITLGAPIFLYGLVNNYLPFQIPGILAKKISKEKEFKGAISMVGGFFTFIIFYTAQIITIYKLTHNQTLTIAYAISLPLTGIFAYWYQTTVNQIRTKWMLIILFYKKSTFISQLITERQQLISEFDKAKNEFIATL